MAGADSNIIKAIKPSLSLDSKDALDKAQIKLEQIHGALDCLFVLTCEKHTTPDEGLGLYKGSLGSVLDLVMSQIAETRSLLCEVQPS